MDPPSSPFNASNNKSSAKFQEPTTIRTTNTTTTTTTITTESKRLDAVDGRQSGQRQHHNHLQQPSVRTNTNHHTHHQQQLTALFLYPVRRFRPQQQQRVGAVSLSSSYSLTPAVVVLLLIMAAQSSRSSATAFVTTRMAAHSTFSSFASPPPLVPLARRQQPSPSYDASSSSRLVLFAGKNKGQQNKRKKGCTNRPVAVNRVAHRNYEILDTLEAGISLKGTEVKAVREGKLNLRDGYVRPTSNNNPTSLVLFNVHIGQYHNTATYFSHEERRPRPLLVHKAQARKWGGQVVKTTGLTMVPLKAYFNDDNRLKIQLALCRGKNLRDKRATIRERDQNREAARIVKAFRV